MKLDKMIEKKSTLESRKILAALVLLIVLSNPQSIASRSALATPDLVKTTSQSSPRVGGRISENTTWTLVDSPYVVVADVIVDAGVFLTIEPGVVIKLTSGTSIVIDGGLFARGNSTHKIRFTSNSTTPAPADYVGIQVRSSAEYVSFDHSIIEYAVTGINFGQIEVSYAFGTVTNSIIRSCNTGILAYAIPPSKIIVENTTISENLYNGLYFIDTTLVIRNSTIYKNGENGVDHDGGTITVENSVISKNNGWGIYKTYQYGPSSYVNNSNVSFNGNGIWGLDKIQSTMISRNRGYGVQNCNEVSNSTIVGNLGFGAYRVTRVLHSVIMYNNLGGVAPSSVESAEIYDSIISQNSEVGIRLWAIGPVKIEKCNVTNNKGSGIKEEGYSLEPNIDVHYSNIQGNTNYDFEESTARGSNATYNWWGITNETLIAQRIYDYEDDFNLGKVYYNPILASPNSIPAPIAPIVKVTPLASFAYTPTEPVVNEIVIFNSSSSSDPDGAIVSYKWDFGDGNITTTYNPIINHAYKTAGTYNVNLTVTDDDELTDTLTKSVTIRKLSSTISILASPATITIGENTTISGSVTPLREGVTLTLWYRIDEGTWSVLTDVTTDENGEYSHYWVPFDAGTYELKATWVGDEQALPSESLITTLDCMKISTFISISTSSSSTFVGFKVNIAGTLRDMYGSGLRNETVVLYYTISEIGTWVPIASATTDNSGLYVATWIPPATGYFTIRAEWQGDAIHVETSNSTKLSSLNYNNQYVFSVESNSTVLGLAFNTTDWKLAFTVTGPDGTKGYVKAIIAKTLVANVADVRVYLNGDQLNYTSTSLDDSWLLHFTYTHSTHGVIISLRTASVPLEIPFGSALTYGIIIAAVVIVAFVIVLKKKHKGILPQPVHDTIKNAFRLS